MYLQLRLSQSREENSIAYAPLTFLYSNSQRNAKKTMLTGRGKHDFAPCRQRCANPTNSTKVLAKIAFTGCMTFFARYQKAQILMLHFIPWDLESLFTPPKSPETQTAQTSLGFVSPQRTTVDCTSKLQFDFPLIIQLKCTRATSSLGLIGNRLMKLKVETGYR